MDALKTLNFLKPQTRIPTAEFSKCVEYKKNYFPIVSTSIGHYLKIVLAFSLHAVLLQTKLVYRNLISN